ncbi:GNAT family N-acetyltransferase [Brevibacterium casei]|uniref:GNAT family N-acetyltransferase n=1 Tax=Brevibacterium casei TaxID=33889 RepID=UPI0028B1E73B|nr:GNAT family N-acetyltransferase [Brevibacterium casei]
MIPADVRPARVSDAPRLAEIHVAAWRAAYRGIMADEFLDGLDEDRFAANWTQALSDPDNRVRNFVVVAGDRILGFGGVSAPRDPAEVLDRLPVTADLGQLAHINLAPEAFGTGVAAVLFTALEDELRHDGYARAYLMVAEGNDRAMRFYEKQGWARTEITHVYDGVEPAVPERMYTVEL